MYSAYEYEEVVSKLPFDATSMASYGKTYFLLYISIICLVKKDKLLIGSKQGHLLSCDHCQNGIFINILTFF